ncbi:MAG: response regulator transcription factor [Candidatus Aminicenantes bacterium]|nr:response regulator transcription factor [Candidatus Aminicenantes bacterium]
MREISVLVVDDNQPLRHSIVEKLSMEADIAVVSEATDGLEAIQKVRELNPDLVLIDIRMPKMNGIEATRRIKEEWPGLKVIVLTIHDLQEYRKVAKKIGADAFVSKVSLDNELIPAIRDVFKN